MIVDDYSTIDMSGIEGVDRAKAPGHVRSVMGAPLRVGDKVVGVVSVRLGAQPRHFTEEELRLLLLVADRAAPAIELAGWWRRCGPAASVQKTLSRRLLTAQEEERRRLAVELHDELGQVLTAVKINLASLERSSGDAPLRRAPDGSDRFRRPRHAERARPGPRPAALRARRSRPARRAALVRRPASRATRASRRTSRSTPSRASSRSWRRPASAWPRRRSPTWRATRRPGTCGSTCSCAATGSSCASRDDGIGFDAAAARDRAIARAPPWACSGCRSASRSSGGDLEIVRTRPAAGTEVRARFPSRRAAPGHGMKPIRVLLADDHTLVRAGIRGLLQGLAGVEVVGEAGDGQEALRLAESLRPDVVLLDVGMPGLNGLEVAGRLARARRARSASSSSPCTRPRSTCCARCARAAPATCSRTRRSSELEIAVRAVARGETYLSPAVSKRVVDDYVSRTGGAADPLDALTPRQREILQLAAEGHSSKEIAQRLGLSFKTVETHRAQLMERLGVHDLAGLVRFAVRVGLVTPEG